MVSPFTVGIVAESGMINTVPSGQTVPIARVGGAIEGEVRVTNRLDGGVVAASAAYSNERWPLRFAVFIEGVAGKVRRSRAMQWT